MRFLTDSNHAACERLVEELRYALSQAYRAALLKTGHMTTGEILELIEKLNELLARLRENP